MSSGFCMKRIALILWIWLLAAAWPVHSQEWEWTDLTSMPMARYGHCSIVFQDKIWVIGGKSAFNMTLSEVDCYDVNLGQWLDDVTEMVNPRYNASAAVYQNKIFVFGGSGFLQNKLNSVEYFDPQTNTWHAFTPMNYEREGMTSVVLNDTLYVIGGTSGNGFITTPLDVVEFWDEATSSWKVSDKWKLQTPRVAMQSLVVKDVVYTFGGVSVAPLNQLEMYRSGSGSQWLSSSPRARFYFAGIAAGDTLFSFGGTGISGMLDSIDIYTIQNDSWETLDITLAIPRAGLSGVNYNGDFYLFGGINPSNGVMNSAQRLRHSSASAVAVIDNPNVPENFGLLGNYPNPFNAGTTIEFEIASAGEPVQLQIYNILGERIREFQLGAFAPGKYEVHWNGCNDIGRPVESGIYFAQLITATGRYGILKMSLVK